MADLPGFLVTMENLLFFAGKAKVSGAETLRGVSEDVEPCLQIAAHTSLHKIETVFTSFPFSV